MPRAGDVLDLRPIGAIFRVTKTAKETQGDPVHIHPHATESYEVLAGELDLYVDGTWRRLAAGESASVAPGIPHTFRNRSDGPARVYNTHAPAMRYGEYFEGIHRVVRSGAVSDGRMTLKALLYLALLMTRFEDEIRSVDPPHAMMIMLAWLARLLGYREPPSRL